MRINILGPSGDTICEDLDAAGINYERCQALPVPGSVYNAGMGEWLELAEGNAPQLSALALLLYAWVKMKTSRSVMIQPKDGRVIHIQGMQVEDVERILAMVERIDVLDTEKPDATEPKKLKR